MCDQPVCGPAGAGYYAIGQAVADRCTNPYRCGVNHCLVGNLRPVVNQYFWLAKASAKN